MVSTIVDKRCVKMSYFKYVLTRGGADVFTPENLSWFYRLIYRLKGYTVINFNKWKAQHEKQI